MLSRRWWHSKFFGFLFHIRPDVFQVGTWNTNILFNYWQYHGLKKLCSKEIKLFFRQLQFPIEEIAGAENLLLLFSSSICRILSRKYCISLAENFSGVIYLQGVSGALEVLMKDAIRPTIMQTLEVSLYHCVCFYLS